MSYSMYLCLTLATAGKDAATDAPEVTPALPDVLQPVLGRVQELVDRLRSQPVSSCAVAQFEKELQQTTRELARLVAQWTYNQLEPAATLALPPQVYFEGSSFRRLQKKTPQQVSMLAALSHGAKIAGWPGQGAAGRTRAGGLC